MHRRHTCGQLGEGFSELGGSGECGSLAAAKMAWGPKVQSNDLFMKYKRMANERAENCYRRCAIDPLLFVVREREPIRLRVRSPRRAGSRPAIVFSPAVLSSDLDHVLKRSGVRNRKSESVGEGLRLASAPGHGLLAPAGTRSVSRQKTTLPMPGHFQLGRYIFYSRCSKDRVVSRRR